MAPTATSEAELTSPTRTFLVPVDARARTLCRDEINAYYCNPNATEAALDACVAAIGATDPSDPCADPTNEACIRTETVDQICVGTSQPTYPTVASCEAPVAKNCSFYSACVEHETPCGEQGYALGYGEKYCTAFENISLSPRGESWKFSVMHCLQEALVPYSQPASTASCDTILNTAFASHPVCYTQPSNSICFLPPSDSAAILSTIGGSELLTARSRTQILATIKTCIGQIAWWLDPFVSHKSTESMPMESDALEEQARHWKALEEQYKAP
jgi:hypothetical protein